MIASVLLLWMLPLFKISVFLSIFLFQAERFVLVPSVSSKTIFTQFPMSLFTLSTIHRDCTTPQVHYGGCSHVVLETFTPWIIWTTPPLPLPVRREEAIVLFFWYRGVFAEDEKLLTVLFFYVPVCERHTATWLVGIRGLSPWWRLLWWRSSWRRCATLTALRVSPLPSPLPSPTTTIME